MFGPNELGAYYLRKKAEFTGESGHYKLLQGLKKYAEPVANTIQTVGIDVGSCVGNYISNISEICTEANTQILCFEPNPVNSAVLEEKIKLYIHPEIKLFKHCISDTTTTTGFYNWKGSKQNAAGNGVAGLRSGGTKICTVDVKKLDTVLRDEFGTKPIVIKFIKIDTEGNDTNVIKSLQTYLPNTRYIIFECSDCLDDARGPGIKNPMKTIVDFLSTHGFDTYRIGTKKLIKVNDTYWNNVYENVKFWSNCFALKKDDTLINKLITVNFDYTY